MDTIPSKDRQEWRNLLEEGIEIKLTNFVLQMQVNQTKKAIKSASISMDEGVERIHDLCIKYALAVKNDIDTIFN